MSAKKRRKMSGTCKDCGKTFEYVELIELPSIKCPFCKTGIIDNFKEIKEK